MLTLKSETYELNEDTSDVGDGARHLKFIIGGEPGSAIFW
jgi:hypothetical protein